MPIKPYIIEKLLGKCLYSSKRGLIPLFVSPIEKNIDTPLSISNPLIDPLISRNEKLKIL